MKIVIELNELFYDILTRCDKSYSDKFHKAIRKGTILPKGHGRLIDADALLDKISKDKREAFTKHQVWLLVSLYSDYAPTIIEADKE